MVLLQIPCHSDKEFTTIAKIRQRGSSTRWSGGRDASRNWINSSVRCWRIDALHKLCRSSNRSSSILPGKTRQKWAGKTYHWPTPGTMTMPRLLLMLWHHLSSCRSYGMTSPFCELATKLGNHLWLRPSWDFEAVIAIYLHEIEAWWKAFGSNLHTCFVWEISMQSSLKSPSLLKTPWRTILNIN